MKINIPNFKDVETGREPFSPGLYEVKITAASATDDAGKQLVSTVKQTPYILWTGTVMKAPEDKFVGRLVFWRTYLTENAYFDVKGLCDALGVDIEDDGFKTEDCLGKNVTLTITQRTDDGGTLRHEVQPQYKPAG